MEGKANQCIGTKRAGAATAALAVQVASVSAWCHLPSHSPPCPAVATLVWQPSRPGQVHLQAGRRPQEGDREGPGGSSRRRRQCCRGSRSRRPGCRVWAPRGRGGGGGRRRGPVSHAGKHHAHVDGVAAGTGRQGVAAWHRRLRDEGRGRVGLRSLRRRRRRHEEGRCC